VKANERGESFNVQCMNKEEVKNHSWETTFQRFTVCPSTNPPIHQHLLSICPRKDIHQPRRTITFNCCMPYPLLQDELQKRRDGDSSELETGGNNEEANDSD